MYSSIIWFQLLIIIINKNQTQIYWTSHNFTSSSVRIKSMIKLLSRSKRDWVWRADAVVCLTPTSLSILCYVSARVDGAYQTLILLVLMLELNHWRTNWWPSPKWRIYLKNKRKILTIKMVNMPLWQPQDLRLWLIQLTERKPAWKIQTNL